MSRFRFNRVSRVDRGRRTIVRATCHSPTPDNQHGGLRSAPDTALVVVESVMPTNSNHVHLHLETWDRGIATGSCPSIAPQSSLGHLRITSDLTTV